MSKLTTVAAGLAVIPMLAFAAPALADSPGQLAGGSNVYVVKNVTQKGAYGYNINATCSEEVQFSVELSNTEYGQLNGINVKATLPTASNSTSTMTATTSAGGSTGDSEAVKVAVPAGATVSYENGSTQLYAGSNVTTLSDGVTTANGVSVGSLQGSTKEFLNFKAKVTCAPTVTPVQIQVCDLSTLKIVTINESDYNSSKYSKDLTKCEVAPTTPVTPTTPVAPTTLVNTGAGSVAGMFTAVAAVAVVASQVVLRRRQARANSN